jgi:alcohol dehydrogenase (NADP+)
MLETKGYAAFDNQTPLKPFAFARREPRESDVAIEIFFCGVCHSDLHQVRNEWQSSNYPMVPGHEIVGRVDRVGKGVKKFRTGEIVGVGCLVDSCRVCESCRAGLEQFCERGPVLTYNGFEYDGKTPTYGGYSTHIVVDEGFVLRVGERDRLDTVAPLLCAGITTYSPLRHWKVGKGHRLGVVGLGGLGHMAVKLGSAMGAEVTLLSHSPGKKTDAERLGAGHFLLTSDDKAMTAAAGQFHFLLDTVSAPHELARYLELLRRDGTMILVGAPAKPAELPASSLIGRRRSVAGSLIGGLAETQEMLDFCAERGIICDVETIPIQQIDNAYDRMLKGDVRYRFVVDSKSLG